MSKGGVSLVVVVPLGVLVLHSVSSGYHYVCTDEEVAELHRDMVLAGRSRDRPMGGVQLENCLAGNYLSDHDLALTIRSVVDS